MNIFFHSNYFWCWIASVIIIVAWVYFKKGNSITGFVAGCIFVPTGMFFWISPIPWMFWSWLISVVIITWIAVKKGDAPTVFFASCIFAPIGMWWWSCLNPWMFWLWLASIVITTLIATKKGDGATGFLTSCAYGPVGILIVLMDLYLFFGYVLLIPSILVSIKIISIVKSTAWQLEHQSIDVILMLMTPAVPMFIGFFLIRKGNQQDKIKKLEVAKKRRLVSEQRKINELKRIQHRDSDQQDKSYVYKIGKHGNESLAIRYGIANRKRTTKEYWYIAKGGVRKRNPDRDTVYYVPSSTISIQKIDRIGNDLYNVILTDYRNRKAKAIIEVGTEYVKTFYPLDNNWFAKYSDLECTLKGNGSFDLKELATFHINKTVVK